MDEEMKSGSYAKAVASFRSIDDTHPSYRDRLQALEKGESGLIMEDTLPASDLLPDAAEEGRKLTIQFLQWRTNRRR